MAIPTIDMVRTGQNINRLRKAAGVTVRDLQDVFGFATPQAIYKWQHGAALPMVDNLVLLSAIFKVSIDEILIVEQCDEVTLSASA
ncbi:MAG: helix-turn-helix domain-containing protein [Lachnospiraceae bacterium]|nr:helix-turn-helix domain-containing protein [Lachnospiraceae bacterium]